MAVMGFNHKGKFLKRIKVEQDFTNAIIYGRTGSGKTTGAILPIIEDRIKSDFGLIIYDFKGNLHNQVKYLADKENRLKDVIEIGKPWGKSINILKYLTTKQFLQIVDTDITKSDYWETASKNLLEGLYEVLKLENYVLTKINELQNLEYKNEITINMIHEIINKQSNLKEFLLSFKEKRMRFIENEFLKIFESCESRIINNIASKIDRLKNVLKNLSNFENVDDGDDSGRNGVVSHLSSIILNAASKDFLNKDEIDLIEASREAKIIIIDVSDVNENSLNLINLGIYSSLQRVNQKDLKPVSIVIDEAQKILNKDYLPETDVCRESRFEYILATQSEALLINKLTKDKYEELISNIVSEFTFATLDNDLEETHEYKDSNWRTYFAEPIFINDKDLFDVERKYQIDNKIIELVDYNKKEEFHLKFDAKLYEEEKVYKVYKSGKRIKTDIYLNTHSDLISEIRNKSDSEKIINCICELEEKNFTDDDMKKIHALAYGIHKIENNIKDYDQQLNRLTKEKEELKIYFLEIMSNIDKITPLDEDKYNLVF